MSRLLAFFQEWLQHHLLHPRVWQTYRQGRQLEYELKNTSDLWDVQDKWVPDEDFGYLLGLAISGNAFQQRFVGALPFATAVVLIGISFIDIWATILKTAQPSYIILSSWATVELIILSIAAFSTGLLALVKNGYSAATISLACLAVLFLAWCPLVHFLASFNPAFKVGIPWLATLGGLYIWSVVNSSSFATLVSNAQKRRTMRAIWKDPIVAGDKRITKAIERSNARKKALKEKRRAA